MRLPHLAASYFFLNIKLIWMWFLLSKQKLLAWKRINIQTLRCFGPDALWGRDWKGSKLLFFRTRESSFSSPHYVASSWPITCQPDQRALRWVISALNQRQQVLSSNHSSTPLVRQWQPITKQHPPPRRPITLRVPLSDKESRRVRTSWPDLSADSKKWRGRSAAAAYRNFL